MRIHESRRRIGAGAWLLAALAAALPAPLAQAKNPDLQQELRDCLKQKPAGECALLLTPDNVGQVQAAHDHLNTHRGPGDPWQNDRLFALLPINKADCPEQHKRAIKETPDGVVIHGYSYPFGTGAASPEIWLYLLSARRSEQLAPLVSGGCPLYYWPDPQFPYFAVRMLLGGEVSDGRERKVDLPQDSAGNGYVDAELKYAFAPWIFSETRPYAVAQEMRETFPLSLETMHKAGGYFHLLGFASAKAYAESGAGSLHGMYANLDKVFGGFVAGSRHTAWPTLAQLDYDREPLYLYVARFPVLGGIRAGEVLPLYKPLSFWREAPLD